MIDTTSVKIVNTSWMMQGQACWLPVSETNKLRTPVLNAPMYLRGHIQRMDGNRKNAFLIYMDQHKGPESVPVGELQKANNDYDKFPEGWNDVVHMNIVNDPEIISNLKTRYKQQQLYTYADKSLISCGVVASDDIASLRSLNEYKRQILDKTGAQLRDLPPHIFSMVYSAYIQMEISNQPQQLILSGLSGSGKSTNVRAAVKLLSKLRDEVGGAKAITLEDMATASIRFLTALGTAKNSSNGYSTRFIANYRFQINTQNRKVLGMQIQSLFLETPRICNQGNGFLIFNLLRNVNILNQIPGGAQFKDIFSKVPLTDLPDSEEDFTQIFAKLQTVGFTNDELQAIVRILAAVALLSQGGNANQLADILQSGSLSSVDLSTEKSRQLVAQDLYLKLFTFVTVKSNEHTLGRITDPNHLQLISVLEQGGLEFAEQGSYFESFMLNYAAERTEQLYIKYAFKTVQEDFQGEKLNDLARSITYHDNSKIVSFFESNLFQQILANDDTTYQNFQSQPDQGIFKANGNKAFVIQHLQGSVSYNVENFFEKNQCKIVEGFQQKVSQTSNAALNQILSSSVNTGAQHTLSLKSQLDSLLQKGTNYIFIKNVRVSPQNGGPFVDKFVIQQLHDQNLTDAVKFVKTGYPVRMGYNDYYRRYHMLDPINKKISLQRHLAMGTDMRGLVIEMNRRLFPGQDKKAMIMGESGIYMKADTGYKLEGLLADWNRKLDNYATKIQGGFKVAMFRKKMMENLKKVAKVARDNPELKGRAGDVISEGNESILFENPEEVARLKKQLVTNQLQQEPAPVIAQQAKEYDEPISDREAYSLLTQPQKEEYKKIKKDRREIINQALAEGKTEEGLFDEAASVSLLTPEQKIAYHKKRVAMGYETAAKPQEAEQVYEISDPESYSLLTDEQKKTYKQLKQSREEQKQKALLSGRLDYQEPDETCSMSLLTEEQKNEKKQRQLKKEEQRRVAEMKALVAEEGFVSDKEAFALLTEEQKLDYVSKKKEQQLVVQAQAFEGQAVEVQPSIAQAMLSKEQQKVAKQKKRENLKQEKESKALHAMEEFLSDKEAYAVLTPAQKEQYKQAKLDQMVKGQNGLKQIEQGDYVPLSYQMLNEHQKDTRRKMRLSQVAAQRRRTKKLYAEEEQLSDPESYLQLTEIQRKQYKNQREEKKNNKKEMNGLKFGYEGIISDPESVKLLNLDQKKEWLKKKEKKDQVEKDKNNALQSGVAVISDDESFSLLTPQQHKQYISEKLQLQENPEYKTSEDSIAEKLLTPEQQQQKEARREKKVEILKAMDDTGITPLMKDTNIDLTEAASYELLTHDQKILRKLKQEELERERRKKLQSGQFAANDDLSDSVAFASLSIQQREERKKREINKEKMKNILNPILFAEDLDDNASVAFALLSEAQRDQIYNAEAERQQNADMQSIAYNMLSDKLKQERNKKAQNAQPGGDSDISDSEIAKVKTIEEKKQLQQDKIAKLETDKANFAKNGEFSDYDAFLQLDEIQKQEYKEAKQEGKGENVAYSLLDKDQKQKLRKRKLKKNMRRKKKAKRNYGIDGEISDIESFQLLTEPQKTEYTKVKNAQQKKKQEENIAKFGQAELSDEAAYALLDDTQKNEYKLRKERKAGLQKEFAKAGFAVEFGDDGNMATVMTAKDQEEKEKRLAKVEKMLLEEDKRLYAELIQQEEEHAAVLKKHGDEDDKIRAKRPTMLKKMGIDYANLKADDFKTRGLDIWPLEATVFMKQIAQQDAMREPIIARLVDNPNLQPHVIGKNQFNKRLLDPSTSIENPAENPTLEEYDPKFLAKVRESDWLKYCDKVLFRNKQFGKKDAAEKCMKNQTDNLSEPLTCVDELKFEKAKQMFRSLLKVGLFKRSRFTPKQHQDKILTGVLGSTALLELPPPPSKLLRMGTERLDKFKSKLEAANKDKLLEDSDDESNMKKSSVKGGRTKAEEEKMKKDEKLKWNEQDSTKGFDDRVKICTSSPQAKLREECYLQIFKQLYKNKTKENIFALLKFAVVVSSLCPPTAEGILPLMNTLLDKIENEKIYKEPDVNKVARKLFRNLAGMAQSIILVDKTKELTQLFPSSVEPAKIAVVYDPKKGDNQLSAAQKNILAPLRIIRTEKEPLLPYFFKIGQGIGSVSDVQFYQLQNILPRKYLPADDEIQDMEQCKQVVVRITLFSETPIWVATEHSALAHQVRDAAVKAVGKENLASFFALYLIVKENNQVQSEKYIEDDEKFMDLLTQMEFNEKIWKEQYNQNKTFDIYLRIKIYYRLFKIDNDSVDLFYYQQNYEVKRNRYPIKPSDALLLAALELYQKHGRYDPSNLQTSKETIEKTIDQYIPQKLLNGSFQDVRMRYHNEYLPTYTFREWAQYVIEQYRDLNFETKVLARWEYLSILRYYDMFLSTQFQCTYFVVSKDAKGVMRKTAPLDTIFAIRPLHVVVTDFPAKKTLRTIHFFDINSWGKSEQQGQNYFFVRGDDGAVAIFEFQDRNLADNLINSYVNWSIGKPLDSHLCQEFNDTLSFLIEKNNE